MHRESLIEMSDNSQDSALQGGAAAAAFGVPANIAVPQGAASVAESYASAVGSVVVLQRRPR